jgi:DNA polymerase III sliding clamp (beta) subunit (PCNA family)
VRVAAALDPDTKKLQRTAGVAWEDGVLHVTHKQADVDDVIDAESNGVGKTALRIPYAVDALNMFSGERVSIAIDGDDTPIRFSDPADPGMFTIVMPVREP